MPYFFTKTGEQFMPDQSNAYELKVNLERYLFAMKYAEKKVVVDAACGAGLGTYLYALVAKNVIAVDYNEDALKYSANYPNHDNVQFVRLDLEKDALPPGDVLISLETIEHLANAEDFIKNSPCKEIVFSVPFHALGVSIFHKYDFKDLDHIQSFFEKYYVLDELKVQENKWLIGHGIKKDAKN